MINSKQVQALQRSLYQPISKIADANKKGDVIIVGITGPPGVGKTTLSRVLYNFLKQRGYECLLMSLEDFYFSKEERKTHGIPVRAIPGSHKLDEIENLFKNIRNGKKIDSVPQYCMVNDIPLEPLIVGTIMNILIFEGWILKTDIPDYKFISNNLDYLIYLDAEIYDCYRWRHDRECIYRKRHGGGLSENEMNIFWKEHLEPGIKQWVIPQLTLSDLVINFDHNHKIRKFYSNK